MVKNNDKWSALSLKDRADLIKIYVDGGILDLNRIKEDYNKFDEGGDLDSDETRLKNATQKTVDYAKHSYRDPARQDLGYNTMYSLLQDNYTPYYLEDSSSYAGKTGEGTYYRYFDTNNDGKHDYRDDKIVKSPYLNPIKAPIGRQYMGKTIELPNSGGLMVSNPFYDPRLKDAASTLLTEFQSDENLERLTAKYADLVGAAGAYSSANPFIQIDPEYKNSVEDITTHEGMHFYTTISPDDTMVKAGNASMYFIPYANSPEFKAKYKDFYWDSPSEVYARVKTFMEANNINNNKPFTQEDYNKLKENYKYSYAGDNVINRYDAETFINLINSVYACGGKINKFKGRLTQQKI